MKNRQKIFGFFLFFAFSNANAVLYKNNATREIIANKSQSKGPQKRLRVNGEKMITYKKPSKPGQRMNAGKIAGITLAVVIGVIVALEIFALTLLHAGL